MSDIFPMFLLLVVAPLLVGVALLILAWRVKWGWAKVVAGISGSFSLLVFLFYLFAAGPYLWALHLESKWRPVNPKTLAELESKLSLYTKKDISREQSGWGSDHKLRSGERMTRYSLLGAPLDVVFNGDNGIVRIYTSYE